MIALLAERFLPHAPSADRPLRGAAVHGDFDIRYEQPLAARPASAIRVTCVAGVAWLTSYGDPEDHILVAGQAYVAGAGERLVVAGCPACRVRIEPAAAAALG